MKRSSRPPSRHSRSCRTSPSNHAREQNVVLEMDVDVQRLFEIVQLTCATFAAIDCSRGNAALSGW